MGSFSNKWNMFVEVFIEKEGYRDVLTGLANTMLIALISLCIGILLGTLIAACEVVDSKRRSILFLRHVCRIYVASFRGTPVVVQLLLGYFVLLPLLDINLNSLVVATLIMGLNSAAYVSEIMRSGILSVDSGQMEAGRALGLSYHTTMMKIIIPQAVKNILPTLGNELISLIKETSVVSFIGVVDLYKAFRSIGSSNYEYMIPFLVMAVIYIVIILILTGLLRILERGLRNSDQR